jgi:hypothetical protein
METVTLITAQQMTEADLIAAAKVLSFPYEHHPEYERIGIRCGTRWSGWSHEPGSVAMQQLISCGDLDLAAEIRAKNAEVIWTIEVPWDCRNILVPLFEVLLKRFDGILWYSARHRYNSENVSNFAQL